MPTVRSAFLWVLVPFVFGAGAVRAVAAPADELTAAVERMSKVTASFAPSFSADGKQIAFLSTRSGTPQAWIATVDTKDEPRRLLSTEDPVSGVFWSPDGQWLALSIAPGGGLNEQIYLIRPDGSGMKRLTDGGKENNQLAGWSGRFLRFSSNKKDADSLDAYLYDSATGETRFVAANPGLGELADLTPDGKRGLVERLKSRGDSNIYLIDGIGPADSADSAKAKEVLLTPHAPPGEAGNSAFGPAGPDGQSVYFVSNLDADRFGVVRVRIDAAGKALPPERLLFREDAEVEELKIDPVGGRAALTFNVAGRSELNVYDLGTGKLTPIKGFPGDQVFGLKFSPDGQRLAFSMLGARNPAEIWVVDLASGRARAVTQGKHEGIDLERLVAPELVRFPSFDGLEISGWLYRPASWTAGKPGPVVLSFHGGPEGQERPNFIPSYQMLLKRGIGVFAPNVRGSSGFGKRFVNLDNGALRFNGLKDMEACARYLIEKRVADPKRIGIMGGSYGGYMTLAGLTEYPDLFAAGADLFGMVDFETFFANTEPWMAAISTIEYGDPKTQKELLASLSPIHKLDRIKAPLLVLHGANDTNVPVIEAEQVARELKKRNVPVQYVLFPDEGHGFRKLPNRIRSTVEIVRWFERYLASPEITPATAPVGAKP